MRAVVAVARRVEEDFSTFFDSAAFSSFLPSLAFASALLSDLLAAPEALWSALAVAEGCGEVEGLDSSVTGVEGFLDCEPLIWEEMMAGSTGAPFTVAWPVGARLAGGVYRFSFPEVSDANSPRRTPLYL